MDEPTGKRPRMEFQDRSANRDKLLDVDEENGSTNVSEVENSGTLAAASGQNRPIEKNKPNTEIPKESEIATLGVTDFKIIKTDLAFVDKSECIKNFFHCGGKVILATAPRRFGKSTFINMLKRFLEVEVTEDGNAIINRADGDNYKMFMNLKLGVKDPTFVEKHCGQHPVIVMNLKEVEGNTEAEILDSLKTALHEAFLEHSYLIKIGDDGSKSFKNNKLMGSKKTFLKYYEEDRLEELNKKNVQHGLKFLSEILHTHFDKKVVILIDECDAPIMKAIHRNMDDDLLKYMIKCITNMMSAALKGNDRYLERALSTSCVRVSGVFSWQVNNQVDVLFLQNDNFSPVYGFTKEEVDTLFQNDEFQAVKDLDGIEAWYDGYQAVVGLDKEKKRIYSSWSVLNYLKNSVPVKQKMFDRYWPTSSVMEILGKLFVRPEVQVQVNKLLDNEEIEINVTEPSLENILKLKQTICGSQHHKLFDSQVHFFLQLLWDSGLLNAVEHDGSSVTLKIPNWEIKWEIQLQCYTQSLFNTKYKLEIENMNRYIQALKKLLLINTSYEEETLKEKFQEYVNAVSGLFSDNGTIIPGNESELHHILFYLAYNSDTHIAQANRAVQMKSHRKEKRGRKNEFDMLVTLGTVGIIFELKYCKEGEVENSKAALAQIIHRDYFTFLNGEMCKHLKTQIYIGLCFKANKNVTMHYLINTIKIEQAKFLKSTSAKATEATASTATK